MKASYLPLAAMALALCAGGQAFAQSSADAQSAQQPAASDQPASAPSAARSTSDANATTNVRVITNGPVPDTPENRALFKPLSNAGRNTKPAGN